MKTHIRLLTEQYWFRLGVSLCFAITAALFYLNRGFVWMILSLCFLIFSIWRQLSLYRIHIRRVLFMIDAPENNDDAIHLLEEDTTPETRDINCALNRVGHILYDVRSGTAQQEKYYELIFDCINTGVLVLNDNGVIYQKNNEALRLLGLNVLIHICQLSRVDVTLMQKAKFCRTGEKLQITFNNERGTVNLPIRVLDITIHKEHLRILTFSDINSELNEKKIGSWMCLTRVSIHEIMNSVTLIISLSDTLLSLSDIHDEEIRNGLQIISTTGKGLLAFVESYQRSTRIPTPEPFLFYVKAFIDRMVELARYQNTCESITFHTNIFPADLIVYVSENLISQAVINLLKDAIRVIGIQAGGKIEISARCNDLEEVLIKIKNSGPAIPPEIADHIFILFFTTKEGGSGIGLSISHQIVRLSGGSITLLLGKEAKFVLEFK